MLNSGRAGAGGAGVAGSPAEDVVRFGVFELDLKAGQLTRYGQRTLGFERSTRTLRTVRAIVIVIGDYGIPGISSRPAVLRLRRFLAGASLFLTLFCASPAKLDAETPPAEQPKGVLLLYMDEMSHPAERAADEGIRSVLGNKPDIRIYSEHLDTALFPDPKFQAAQSAWLKNKYRDRRIDLVIAVGLPSQTLLPDIPTVFCAMERNGLSHATLPPNATAVWPTPDFEGTLTAAARLQPGAHQVVVLSGTTAWDRHVEMGPPKHTAAPWDSLGYQLLDTLSVEGMRCSDDWPLFPGIRLSCISAWCATGRVTPHFTGVDSFFLPLLRPHLRFVGWLHRLRDVGVPS